MQKSAWIDVRAIASRSEAAARQAAAELRIPRAYGSYEALLADPEIEAVYNPRGHPDLHRRRICAGRQKRRHRGTRAMRPVHSGE
jgi:predicted dehydrogenase